MADFFQNGLLLTAPASAQCGRTFSRWLYEWTTKVIGMSVVDAQAAEWEAYVHQEIAPGTGFSIVGEPAQFDIGTSTYDFDSTNDVGAYLTITGFTDPTLNGIYRILKVLSTKRVELDIKFSVLDSGLPEDELDLEWSLWRPDTTHCPAASSVAVLGGTGTTVPGDYTYHIYMNVRSSNSYFPEFSIAPYDTSWNPTTHTWDDAKHTANRGIDNWNNSVINVDNCRVWAAGDKDRVVIMLRMEDNYYAWHFVYLGEMDASFPVTDTRPVLVWAGSNRGNATPGQDNDTLVGTGLDASVPDGGRWLAFDEVTTLTGRFMYYHTAANYNSNYFADRQRRWSMFSRQYYLQQIICECITSGNAEIRGSLRRCWVTSRGVDRFKVMGDLGEFAHITGGIVIPWNQSIIWYER